MKTATVYIKTMAYVWLKSLLCLISVAVAVILYFTLYIGLSLIGEGPGATGFIVWLILVPFIYPMIRYFFGHRIEAGHLNAINEAISTEHLPIALLSTMDVEAYEQFPFFSTYKEVELAAFNCVKQLYERIDASTDLFKDTNYRNWQVKIVRKAIIKYYLSYISLACVGQIFAKSHQKQERTLVQSISAFYTHWTLFFDKTPTRVSRMVISTAITWVIMTAASITVSLLIGGAGIMVAILGIAIGYILAAGIKVSFIDPIHIIRSMKVFSEISVGNCNERSVYENMAAISPAFAKLWQKLDGTVTNKADIIKQNNDI